MMFNAAVLKLQESEMEEEKERGWDWGSNLVVQGRNVKAIKEAFPGCSVALGKNRKVTIGFKDGDAWFRATVSPKGAVRAEGPGGIYQYPTDMRLPSSGLVKMIKWSAGVESPAVVTPSGHECGFCRLKGNARLASKPWRCRCGALNDPSEPTTLAKMRRRCCFTLNDASEVTGLPAKDLASFERVDDPVRMSPAQLNLVIEGYSLTPAEQVELMRDQAKMDLVIPRGEAVMVVPLPSSDDQAERLVASVRG